MKKFLKVLKYLIHPLFLLINWAHKALCDRCEDVINPEEEHNHDE